MSTNEAYPPLNVTTVPFEGTCGAASPLQRHYRDIRPSIDNTRRRWSPRHSSVASDGGATGRGDRGIAGLQHRKAARVPIMRPRQWGAGHVGRGIAGYVGMMTRHESSFGPGAERDRQTPRLHPRIDHGPEHIAVRGPHPSRGTTHQSRAAGIQDDVANDPAELANMPRTRRHRHRRPQRVSTIEHQGGRLEARRASSEPGNCRRRTSQLPLNSRWRRWARCGSMPPCRR